MPTAAFGRGRTYTGVLLDFDEVCRIIQPGDSPMKRLILPALLSLAVAGSATAATYNIDGNHTQVQFTYSHLGYSHISGRLNQPTGSFDFDPANPAKSSIDVQLPMSSLSTGVPRLDADLSGANFFDVEKFPTASFKSSKVTVLGKDKLSVAGDLTIHGVTRPVVLDVIINSIGIHPMRKVAAAGFDASATIKRSDFGVGKMVPMIGDEVKLSITMEASEPKKEQAEAKKAG
jgi:polyisoprenoid-binding protein YceI